MTITSREKGINLYKQTEDDRALNPKGDPALWAIKSPQHGRRQLSASSIPVCYLLTPNFNSNTASGLRYSGPNRPAVLHRYGSVFR